MSSFTHSEVDFRLTKGHWAIDFVKIHQASGQSDPEGREVGESRRMREILRASSERNMRRDNYRRFACGRASIRQYRGRRKSVDLDWVEASGIGLLS